MTVPLSPAIGGLDTGLPGVTQPDVLNTDRIVYFGDSLSDNGNIFAVSQDYLTEPLPFATAGYVDGVFSNGEVFSEVLPELLGFDTVENYAFGGAEALGTLTFGDFDQTALEPILIEEPDEEILNFDINFGAQIDRFEADEALLPFEGSTTVSMLIGLNDLGEYAANLDSFDSPIAAGFELLGDIAQKTIDEAFSLGDAGLADSFILYTLPTVNFFPGTDALSPLLLTINQLIVDTHTQGIFAGAAALNDAGYDTAVVELGVITSAIINDPTAFGFLSTEQFLFGTPTAPLFDEFGNPVLAENPATLGLDDDQVLFFDDVHPTAAGHGIFAAFSEAALTKDVIDMDRVFQPDFEIGTAGEELVLGRDGNDTIFTLGGNDVVIGSIGDDTISLGSGNDIGIGGLGKDQINGSSGSDVLAGSRDADILNGGLDADVLIVDGVGDGLGLGDVANGGLGGDTFLYTSASLVGGTSNDLVTVNGGFGFDVLYVSGTTSELLGVQADLSDSPGATNLFLSSVNLMMTSIEAVILVPDRMDLASVSVNPAAQDIFDEAVLWNIV